MATKSNKKTNTRVSKKAKGPANHLKIWVGVLVVLIVAVVGVAIVRFSEAGLNVQYSRLDVVCDRGNCYYIDSLGGKRLTKQGFGTTKVAVFPSARCPKQPAGGIGYRYSFLFKDSDQATKAGFKVEYLPCLK